MAFQGFKKLSKVKTIFNKHLILQSSSKNSVKHDSVRSLKVFLLLSIILLSLFLSCYVTEKPLFKEEETLNYSLFPYPTTRFAVLSDLHLYSLTLGGEGEAK